VTNTYSFARWRF